MDIKIVNPILEEDREAILNFYKNDFSGLEFIAEGSQGIVYRYKNYAIKSYEYGLDGPILEKFQDSPLFLKLYMYNEEFMVTDYLDIINAYDYFERNINIELTGLDIYKYCISKGYIPYDIHDENVVVTKDEKLKIIDVGSFKKINKYNVNSHDLYYVDYEELNCIIDYVKKPKIAI